MRYSFVLVTAISLSRADNLNPIPQHRVIDGENLLKGKNIKRESVGTSDTSRKLAGSYRNEEPPIVKPYIPPEVDITIDTTEGETVPPPVGPYLPPLLSDSPTSRPSETNEITGSSPAEFSSGGTESSSREKFGLTNTMITSATFSIFMTMFGIFII